MPIPDSGATAQVVNYKSDFDFILHLKDCDGADIGFPQWDWTALIYTKVKPNGYTVSSRGGVLTNCYNDGGQIHVVVDNHRLGAGVLNVEFVADLDNVIYPDGQKRVVVPAALGIELIEGAAPCSTTFDVELLAPVVYLTAYDLAVKAGYTGTLEQYITYVNDFPQVVETSKMLSRVLSDLAEGKAMVADALTRQGADTAPDEPMAVMADRILDLRLAVDGQPQIVDQTLGGTLPTYDLLNELRNHQRADYPYCCGVMFPRTEPDVELKMADAYLCSDGFFTEDQDVTHTLTDTDRDMSYVIYYFRQRRYTVPTYIETIIRAYALNGHPCWSVARSIPDVRSYTQDMDEYTSDELMFSKPGPVNLALSGVHKMTISRNFLYDALNVQTVSFPDLEELYSNATGNAVYHLTGNILGYGIFLGSLKILGAKSTISYYNRYIKHYINNSLEECAGTIMTSAANLERATLLSLKNLTGVLFSDCAKLRHIETSNLTKSSGTLALNCAALETIDASVETIEGGTLVSNCASLEELSVPLRVLKSGTLVSNCASLKEFTVPVETVTNSCLCAGWQQSAERVVIHLPNLKRMVCSNNYGSSNSGIENVMEFYMPNLEHISGTFGRNSYEKLKYIFHLGNKQNGYYYFYMDVGWCNAEITIEPGFRSTLFINYSSFRLTAENMRDIIANLGDNTGYPTLALTLGATNLAKLTDEDIAIATSKNYTVA